MPPPTFLTPELGMIHMKLERAINFILGFATEFLRRWTTRFCPTLGGRRKIHKARIPKYPYSIYYEIIAEEFRVLAVVHGARNPKYLNYRLR